MAANRFMIKSKSEKPGVLYLVVRQHTHLVTTSLYKNKYCQADSLKIHNLRYITNDCLWAPLEVSDLFLKQSCCEGSYNTWVFGIKIDATRALLIDA